METFKEPYQTTNQKQNPLTDYLVLSGTCFCSVSGLFLLVHTGLKVEGLCLQKEVLAHVQWLRWVTQPRASLKCVNINVFITRGP